ncbi:MAG: hypothetical protein EON93_13200 [Burkholderiales bacterium]|nr:MAG: hypothetical protein EON93_13200 [Burkholderiales bacterium]
MRLVILSVVAALAGCAAPAMPVTQTAMPEFAIPNPQRPGAKATDCKTLIETTDGCVFHTAKDDINRAKLSASADATWVAHPSAEGIVTIREVASEPASDGKTYQIVEVVPTTPGDADITVTFDKLTGAAGAQKVVERRRVSVMIHAS